MNCRVRKEAEPLIFNELYRKYLRKSGLGSWSPSDLDITQRFVISLEVCRKIVSLQSNYRGVEQLVARRAHNPKVVGSSPAPATKTIKRLYFYSVTVFFEEMI